MSRRFVAFGVPPEVRDALRTAIAPVRRRSQDHAWTDPDGWHVTLAFLGELPDDRVADVRAAVRRGLGHGADDGAGDGGPSCGSDAEVEGADPSGQPRGSLGLRLGAPGRFGRRVLHLEVVDEPSGAVAALGERIQAALADAGLPVDRRTVRAHLTLARARRRTTITDALLEETAEALTADLGPGTDRWTVDRVALWSARDGRGPARYVVDGTVPLPV